MIVIPEIENYPYFNRKYLWQNASATSNINNF